MEFIVEFKVNVPDGTAKSEVEDRERAEAAVAAQLVGEGHLLRVWKRPLAHGETIVGLYRADSDEQLDGLLRALPLYEWMDVAITPLESHPNDPGMRAVATLFGAER
jgi:muconolactone D-isomerase